MSDTAVIDPPIQLPTVTDIDMDPIVRHLFDRRDDPKARGFKALMLENRVNELMMRGICGTDFVPTRIEHENEQDHELCEVCLSLLDKIPAQNLEFYFWVS